MHLPGDGHSKELSQAQVWTWTVATKVMDGVAEVVARHRRGYTLYEEAFPVFPGADKIAQALPLPEGMIQRPKLADEMAPKLHENCMCPACLHRAGKTSWEHNRIRGECKWPFEPPIIWGCDACNNSINRELGSHTRVPGECRWEALGFRQSTPRTSAHPRVPRQAASGSSTAHLPGTHDGVELGADIWNRSTTRQLGRLIVLKGVPLPRHRLTQGPHLGKNRLVLTQMRVLPPGRLELKLRLAGLGLMIPTLIPLGWDISHDPGRNGPQ